MAFYLACFIKQMVQSRGVVEYTCLGGAIFQHMSSLDQSSGHRLEVSEVAWLEFYHLATTRPFNNVYGMICETLRILVTYAFMGVATENSGPTLHS